MNLIYIPFSTKVLNSILYANELLGQIGYASNPNANYKIPLKLNKFESLACKTTSFFRVKNTQIVLCNGVVQWKHLSKNDLAVLTYIQ